MDILCSLNERLPICSAHFLIISKQNEKYYWIENARDFYNYVN